MSYLSFINHCVQNNIHNSKRKIFFLLLVFLFVGLSQKSALALTTPSILYVPLIGITSVPDPLALPKGPGTVTYNYAVKNFLAELPLTEIKVVDNTCPSVTFVGGDDNGNSMLDYNETWRFTCTTKISQTTQSIATATGFANNITATHKAYATVVVGSNTPPPLISVVNISKVAYPLSLPPEGGKITFVYKVNNPGIVPLYDVTVIDNKCPNMSGRLGDTNGNNLLDINEVWIYNCTTTLKETTTNTVNVTAFANGLKATADSTITVVVDNSVAKVLTKFPNVGQKIPKETNSQTKIMVWATLSVILVILILIIALQRKNKLSEIIKIIKQQDQEKKQ